MLGLSISSSSNSPGVAPIVSAKNRIGDTEVTKNTVGDTETPKNEVGDTE